jgi:copper chaperone
MPDIEVGGMSCEHCRAAVIEAIRALPGVTGVSVDLEKGRASWDGHADPQAVRQAVRELGFSA